MVFSIARCISSAVALSIVPAGANHFLARELEPSQIPSIPILEELERVLGSDRRMATESRVGRLEEALRPMFQAMPKQSDGGLRSDAVRYVLHRLFVDRHGWYVKGLEPGGESWNASSPASIFQAHAGSDVHDFFLQRLDEHNFTLHHVSVLAATLENFVHVETVERLHAAYALSGVSQHEEDANEEEVSGVIDTYMMLYVLGRNHSDVTSTMMDKYRKVIHKVYPTWDATSVWARGLRQEIADAETGVSPTSFAMTTKVLEEVADRYGRWQDKECQDIKTKLMKLEVKNTGRVPIEAFYSSALSGNWQFSESVPYLRQLGVLDESDPDGASVMIPNYVNSPSNCVASSKYYEVCCINECETLFGSLEHAVASPDASPARIIELVSALPSATVHAPREITTELVQRLNGIAAQYDGMVPLHSRLFSQWMHHAYPRECPFPHLSGTTKPVSAKQYKQETGEKATVSKEAMGWHVENAKQRGSRRDSENKTHVLPWTPEDELLVCRPAVDQRAATAAAIRTIAFEIFMFWVALSSATASLVGLAVSTMKTVNGLPKEKYMV